MTTAPTPLPDEETGGAAQAPPVGHSHGSNGPIAPPMPKPERAESARQLSSSPNATPPPLPESTLTPRRGRLSAAWMIPLLALLFAGVILYQSALARGPRITIQFSSGSGIEPNDPVTYRSVRVGTVRSVSLSPDLTHVRVAVDLRPDAAPLAREGTTFWVVRPEVSLTRVAGLETIIGPRYIAAEPALPLPEGGGRGGRGVGSASSPTPVLAPKHDFIGLDQPPRTGTTHTDDAALELVLRAQRLGSVTENAPVTYRDLKVGTVTAIALADSARRIEIRVRIEPQYAYLVRANTRFWNISGIGLDMGLFRGLKLKAESLESILAGGIAFATPTSAGPPVEDGHAFDMELETVEDWMKWSPALTPP